MAGGAYEAIRDQCLADQGKLCAYCESRIGEALTMRIEHIHPKSDLSSGHNWALDWNNLIAVCPGGSQSALAGTEHFRLPLPRNLSCDAHKDHLISQKKLLVSCEAHLANPLDLVAFPMLFELDRSDGSLHPIEASCKGLPLPPGAPYKDFHEFLVATIDVLNLNCDRLKDNRLAVSRSIERAKRAQYQKRIPARQVLAQLSRQALSFRWPSYFSTRRFCLAPEFDVALVAMGFSG